MLRRDFLTAMGSLAGLSMLPFPALAASAESSGLKSSPPDTGLAPRFGDGRDWWFQKRFGLFVHWGLYAINGWHEQEQWRNRIPRAEYEKLRQQWNPVKFNPDQWLDVAEETGMKYLCFTTKHHDGFCLFNSKVTSYNTINSPYKKDILELLAAACHRRKFPLCLYYSIADWHHPNYPNQGRHHELQPQPGDRPDWPLYLEFLKAQVRELCSNYGEIHGFWWDMNVEKHEDPSINQMIRKLQPKAVINDRGFDAGDFGTPERDYTPEKGFTASFNKRTEACQSLGMESWGYRKEEDYYTDRHLIRSIDRYLARDANYLLNVGPKADGSFPTEATSRLRRIGAWYRAAKDSLEGATPASQLTSNRNVLLSAKGNSLFVHMVVDPPGDAIKLKPISVLPRRATLLNDGRKLQWSVDVVPSEHVDQARVLRLRALPVNEMANTVMVAKLEFDRPVREMFRQAGDSGTATESQK